MTKPSQDFSYTKILDDLDSREKVAHTEFKDMDKAELYRIIRQESTLLWVGAGFSLNAGMPSGNEIKELLYESLNELQKKEVFLEDSLQRFTRNFEILFGREKLISILQKRIDTGGTDTFYHDLLARIAHFRSIITTNYDKLIENSFKRKLGIIVLDDDVFAGGQALNRLYKVHGDISNIGDSIVLTEQDYSKQYNRDFKTPFWSSVLSEISTKHVIFLGFGNEDGNIIADFEKIESHAPGSGRKKILIAPAYKNEVDRVRIRKLGIEHMEMFGQEFLMELIADIKVNLHSDYASGKVDSTTVQEFANAFDLKVTLTGSPDGVRRMDLQKASGQTIWNMNLSTANESVKNIFTQSGDFLDPVEIKGSQLIDFSLEVEGFHLIDISNIDTISLVPSPIQKGKCSIEFPEEEFEVENISFELFYSAKKTRIIAGLYGYTLKLEIGLVDEGAKLDFNIENFTSKNSAKRIAKIQRMLYLATSGHAFRIETNKGTVTEFQLPLQTDAKKYEEFYEFFSKLEKIERFFKIRFGEIDMVEFNSEAFYKVRKLISLIDNGYYAIEDPEGLILDRMPPSQKLYDALLAKQAGANLYMSSDSNASIELLGKTLELGQEQISILEPTLIATEPPGGAATLIAKDNTIVYRYKKFGHHEPKGTTTLWQA